MEIILMMLMFLIGSYILGIVWVLVFWIFSFLFYIVACISSKLGIFFDVSGEKNIWLLFLVVCGISWLTFNAISDVGCAIGGLIFVFLSGVFMLFRTANTFKING